MRKCEPSGIMGAVASRWRQLSGNFPRAHFQVMTRLKVLKLLFFLLSLTCDLCAQEKKSEQELAKYKKQLKSSRIDTVLILKSGCTGCQVTYSDTFKAIEDGQTIYVLTQRSGHFKLAIFDDIHNPKYLSVDSCSLFETVHQNKSVLKSKDTFYQKELAELKKMKFLPPRPTHYPYKSLIISLPGFQYDCTVNGSNSDYLGFVRESENWFNSTKTIIKKFFDFINTLRE